MPSTALVSTPTSHSHSGMTPTYYSYDPTDDLTLHRVLTRYGDTPYPSAPKRLVSKRKATQGKRHHARERDAISLHSCNTTTSDSKSKKKNGKKIFSKKALGKIFWLR